MKDEIKITIYVNPTNANPESYRMKVKYKDQHDSGTVKTTYPRWKDEQEAEKQRAKWYVDYGRHTGFFAPPAIEPQPEPDAPLTFREYAAKYWQMHEKNLKSGSHESDMKILIQYFNKTPLNEIDYAMIYEFEQTMRHTPYKKEIKVKATEQMINPKTGRKHFAVTKQTIENPRSDSTVNHYVKRLRHLLYQAHRERKISEKPDFHLIIKAENNKPTTAITFAEFEKLLAACAGEREHLYLQILCVFETGCRTSEYKAIRKRDLNIETRFCWVNISKQKKSAKQRPPRRVYFSQRLIEAIKADGFNDKKSSDFLFHRGDYKRAWATSKKLAFSDMKDTERREKLLDLDLQRSLRKSAAVHYDKSRIQRFVKDYQLSHAPDTTGGKHYEEVEEDLQFAEFQLYEEFSKGERAKLQKIARVVASG